MTGDFVDHSKDLEVFGRAVAWSARQFTDYSMADLVSWMIGHLDDGNGDDRTTRQVRERLLNLIHFHSPEQKEAEVKVCQVLKRELSVSGTKWRVREDPGRSVDWSRTYMSAYTDPPQLYHCREHTKHPDTRLRSALVYEATQWLGLLQGYATGEDEKTDAVEERISQLEDTICSIRKEYIIEEEPLDRAKISRLSRQGNAGAQAAAALNRLAVHRYSAPDTAKLTAAFKRAREETEGWWQDEGESKLLNNLLEFSALATITETASRLPDWKLQSIDRKAPFEATLYHQTQPVALAVGKSFREPVKYEDAFIEMQQSAGMTENRTPSGGQPDLRLTFYHRGDPDQNISVLGDAKRNSKIKNQGADYFQNGVRTAAYYLAAFTDALDAKVKDGKIIGAIQPTFTLFFRQGITLPNNVLVALRERDEMMIKTMPLLAFELDHLRSENGRKLLEGWLELICGQALAYLI